MMPSFSSKKLFVLYLLFCFLFVAPHLLAQDRTPGPPVLKSADIIPGTDSVRVSWKLSDSSNVAYYCIYTNFGKGWIRLDSTANATDSVLTILFPLVNQAPQRICLAAVPLNGNFNSPLSNENTTNFLQVSFDSCALNLNLKWTGYLGWGSGLVRYRVLRTFPDGSEKKMAETDASVRSFSLRTNPYEDYCFHIQAVRQDSMMAASNRICRNTSIPHYPAWIYADQITVNTDGTALIQAHSDLSADAQSYVLARAIEPMGPYTAIDSLPETSEKEFFFNVNADKVGAPSYFRIWAVNMCRDTVVGSNIATAMKPVPELVGDEVQLHWNPYIGWIGGVEKYQVFRLDDSGNTILAGETDGVTPYFSESLQDLSGKGLSGNLCYFVTAKEAPGNPDGVVSTSRSAIACISVGTPFVMPEIFTPDGDGLNDEFAPVFRFTPEAYLLVVSGLSGKVLFRSEHLDQPWKGTDLTGKKVPPGAYVWYLQFRDFAGHTVNKRGLVTVIIP